MMSAANIIKNIEIPSFSTFILKANISITSFTHITLNVNGIEESESVKLVFMRVKETKDNSF